MSEKFLNVNQEGKNKKCKLLRSYFIIMGEWVTGKWYRPHDPLTHFHLCGDWGPTSHVESRGRTLIGEPPKARHIHNQYRTSIE